MLGDGNISCNIFVVICLFLIWLDMKDEIDNMIMVIFNDEFEEVMLMLMLLEEVVE